MNAKAIIFDCDGVLIDSEDLAWEAWTRTLDRYGQSVTSADQSLLLGRTVTDIYHYFRARSVLPDQAVFEIELNADMARLFEQKLRVFSDGISLVEEGHLRGLRLGVASSSDENRLRTSLRLAGLSDSFEVTVGGNEVTRGKPAPDLYIEAARRLGVLPEHCIAVEDSPIGLAAASAAGMRTLVVVRAHTDRDRLAGASLVVDELSGAALDEVLSLFGTDPDRSISA